MTRAEEKKIVDVHEYIKKNIKFVECTDCVHWGNQFEYKRNSYTYKIGVFPETGGDIYLNIYYRFDVPLAHDGKYYFYPLSEKKLINMSSDIDVILKEASAFQSICRRMTYNTISSLDYSDEYGFGGRPKCMPLAKTNLNTNTLNVCKKIRKRYADKQLSLFHNEKEIDSEQVSHCGLDASLKDFKYQWLL